MTFRRFWGSLNLLKPTVRIVLFSVIDLGFNQRRIHLGVIADVVFEQDFWFSIVDCSYNLNLCKQKNTIKNKAIGRNHLVQVFTA